MVGSIFGVEAGLELPGRGGLHLDWVMNGDDIGWGNCFVWQSIDEVTFEFSSNSI